MLSIFSEHSYTIRENIMFTKYFTKERLILLNRFRSDAGRECRNSMHEWGYIVSPRSDCDAHQTMRHIVNECPLTCFDGGISELHQAHDAVFKWAKWLLRQNLRSWKQTTTTISKKKIINTIGLLVCVIITVESTCLQSIWVLAKQLLLLQQCVFWH